MFRRTTLRTKLVLLALVPLVAVFVMAARSVRADFDRANAASEQSAEVERAFRIYEISRALERELLVDRLVAPSAGEEPNQVSPRGLDEAIQAFLSNPASADESTVAAVDAFAERLPDIRTALRVDDDEVYVALVAANAALAADPNAAATVAETPDLESAAVEWTAFTRFIDAEQEFDTSIFTDSATTSDALTLEMTASLREAVALQGAAFSSLLTSPEINSQLLVSAAQASAATERAQEDLVKFGSTDFVDLVLDDGGAELSARIAADADDVLSQSIGVPPSIDVTTVRPAYLSADQLLIGAVDTLYDELTSAVTATESAARSSAVTTLLMLAAMTLGILLLVLLLYRSIRRPLQRVTERSRDIANVQLPGVVATMRADVDAELPEIEAIPVESRDEIGELVAAFNQMSSTAVDLVGEQAAARRSIADMFMNLGRRNQKLLNRLLRNLDRLERNEEDPDVLAALYDIDHITTRMRRNAESLLVLAGAEQSRSFAQPATAGDVVRAALTEVENYQRVMVTGDANQLLTGEAVADVAHLLAELIENALAFSRPETTVQVATRMTSRGYIFVVSDDGVGMSADKLAESNQRIAMAASREETPSKFLGLFVVGRLAFRRGIDVELFESPSGGVTARVTLPASALHTDRAGSQPAIEVPKALEAPVVPRVPATPLDLPTPVSATAMTPPAYPMPDPSIPMTPVQAMPLMVPPAHADVVADIRPPAPPVEPSMPEPGAPRSPNRPNRFGATGRQPGTHLPRTVVQQSATGAGGAVDVVDVVVDHGADQHPLDSDLHSDVLARDADSVKHSLSSFQSGTTQADQRTKTEEIAGTP